MRALYILAFAAFPLGAMATLSGTAPESSGIEVANAPAGTLSGAVAAVRKIASHIATPGTQSWSDPPAVDQDGLRLVVGEVLPGGTALYAVPRHESYRYAVVQGQRAIVDAASRQIVYIIR
jgi:hypothetical protein